MTHWPSNIALIKQRQVLHAEQIRSKLSVRDSLCDIYIYIYVCMYVYIYYIYTHDCNPDDWALAVPWPEVAPRRSARRHWWNIETDNSSSGQYYITITSLLQLIYYVYYVFNTLIEHVAYYTIIYRITEVAPRRSARRQRSVMTWSASLKGKRGAAIRGSHLSNATCITHAFFKHESIIEHSVSIRQVAPPKTNQGPTVSPTCSAGRRPGRLIGAHYEGKCGGMVQ